MEEMTLHKRKFPGSGMKAFISDVIRDRWLCVLILPGPGGNAQALPKKPHTKLCQDWLDNLGLPVPATIDEVYTTLNVFKEDDRDQNGLDDTYGLMVESAL